MLQSFREDGGVVAKCLKDRVSATEPDFFHSDINGKKYSENSDGYSEERD